MGVFRTSSGLGSRSGGRLRRAFSEWKRTARASGLVGSTLVELGIGIPLALLLLAFLFLPVARPIQASTPATPEIW